MQDSNTIVLKGVKKATGKTDGSPMVRLAGLEPALPAPEAGALIR